MKAHHFFIVFALVFVFGCGSGANRSGLTGKVTLDGQPLDTGTLQLIPDDSITDKQPGGAVISNGKYSIPADPGIPHGIYTVRISSLEPTSPPPGFSITDPNSWQMLKQVKPTDRIPVEWNTASTQTIEIKKGRNQHDFNITTK